MSATEPPAWTALRGEAVELVAAAQREGIATRVVGSTGICLHCEAASAALERFGRVGKDIDLIVRSGDRKALRALLEGRGYVIDRELLVAMEGTRYSFSQPETGIELDVFVDRLQFSHTIDLGDRFQLHPRTIPLEELLLQKLQVHDLTRNDVHDAIALLSTHRVAEPGEDAAGEAEQVDAGYVAALLARDWGFHHTATANLATLDRALEQERDALGGEEVVAPARGGVTTLQDAIDAAGKSRGWKLRARVGERMQWWEDVAERGGAY